MQNTQNGGNQMDGARTHSLSIVFLGLVIIACGFCIGSLISSLLLAKRNTRPSLGTGSIMSKRISVINEAIREGRSDYEFEVEGFHPVLK